MLFSLVQSGHLRINRERAKPGRSRGFANGKELGKDLVNTLET
jgi:hypothetical protein